MVKVDPSAYPEMATAADVIGAKFFHALGYYVPEYYVITSLPGHDGAAIIDLGPASSRPGSTPVRSRWRAGS